MTAAVACEDRVVAERSPTLWAGDPLPPDVFHAIRRRMVLECNKWDPQVGDVAALAPFPLFISSHTWRFLSRAAEQLAQETLAMERALTLRPDLHGRLGLPRALRRVLREIPSRGATSAAARVMRFDFHPTPDGWRISEVNSDVPGGFTESSAFVRMVAEHFPETTSTGAPAEALAEAIADDVFARGEPGDVVLLSAAGFMEDQQVVANLARLLRQRGLACHLAQPHHLRWRDGRAHLDAAWHSGPVAAIVRFFQAEWLAGMRRATGWQFLFRGGRTPVCNPGLAILSESKRLPLVWDDLGADVSTWRRLLPATRDPRDAPWRRDDDAWLLKTALCNTGDTVTARDLVPPRRWRHAMLNVCLRPWHWVAQRRFEVTRIDTPLGLMRPCVGVYTIDGRACGAYGRLSSGPVVNYAAIDAAVLVVADELEPSR